MAYVNLTKDFSEVRKIVPGTGLTKRQLLGILIGVICGLPVFFTAKYLISVDTTGAVFAMAVVIVPIFLLINFKKDGLYFEDHIKFFYETRFVRNTDRPYQIDNLYDSMIESAILQRKIEKILFRGKSKMEVKKIKASGQTQEIKLAGRKIRIPLVGTIDKKTKRELERMVKKAKLKGEIPESAQDTIPYRVPYKDGIFESEEGFYTITLSYEDITYQLLDSGPKNALFEWWCRLINSFDYDVPFQFNYGNMEVDADSYASEIELKLKNDGVDNLRKEYSDMLLNQYTNSTNNLKKERYLTFGVYAQDYKTARTKLGKVTKHIQKHLRKIGSKNKVLDGYERLELLYRIFHPATKDKLMWNWDMPINTGLSSKDFIAPSSFSFKSSDDLNATKYFKVADRVGAVNYIKIFATDMEDRIISDILSHNGNVWVSIHGRAIPRAEAINMAKDNLNDIQNMIVHQQKDASQSGYSIDILSPELQMYKEAGEDLYHGLQRKDERLFNSIITVVTTAPTRKKLEEEIFDLTEILKPYHCQLMRMDNQQEQGYISSLPLCINKVKLKRTFTTTDMAIFIPFTTKEMYNPTGQYYGMNSLSNNMITVNKKDLVNPNSLTLGAPGFGKTFATKREILDVFLRTDDDIIVIDPEGEYGALIKALGGQVIKIDLNSSVYINPMDIFTISESSKVNDDIAENAKDYDPIASKCSFVASMCELILGNNSVLSKNQLSTIDMACREIYDTYLHAAGKAEQPTLSDLYNVLKSDKLGPAMQAIGSDLCIALTRYVSGSLKYFNHETNIDIHSRCVCFDLKDMDAAQKDLTMLIIQELIWSRVAQNRIMGKFTRVDIDEFHLLLRNPKTAAYCVEIYKRFRKWGGITTGITQNVKDLFRSPEIQNILDTTNFVLMLNQLGDDARILAEHFNLSEEEQSYIKSGEQGKGLLWVEDIKVPFEDEFPKNTMCYKLMNTKASEVFEEIRSKKSKVRKAV